MEETRLTSVSDESESSDSSENKSRSFFRQYKLTSKRKSKHRHKVKKKLKSSQWKKHVSSSSSSNSSHSITDSDSSDSDNMTLKTHRKKPSHKKHSKKVSSKSHSPLSRYRSYLQSYYSNYSVACDDKLSIAPSSEFIKLALIQKDKNDRRLYKATLHRGVDEILKSKVPLELDSLLTVETRLVVVEGPPGIGKSTLCWELCRKWKSWKSLQHYKIILLLKLRERRVQEATSLDKLFYHEDHDLLKSVVRQSFKCEGEGFLLLLDGFDEMPVSVVKNENSLVMKLIRGSCLPKATLLVTSRPSALHQKNCFPSVYRHVEIVGFTDECKVKYAEIAFQSEPEVLIHFKSFIISNPIINSLLYIPVNCAIVTQVYSDIRRSRELNMPKTMTELYSTLILILIKRYMIETNKWNAEHEIPNNLKDLPEEVSTNLRVLCQLAYNGLFKKEVQLMFTFCDIEEILKQSGLCKSDVRENFKHLGLMSEVKEMYVSKGTVTSYSFLHLSIQEFLAAWYVSDHPDLISEVKSRIIVDSRVTPHLNAFGRFLAGIMSKNSPSFPWFKNCIFRDDTHYIMHCLYETQDSGSVVSCLSDLERPLFVPKHPLVAYVFGYCVVHAPVQWRVIIDGSLLNVLVSSLTDHDKEIRGSFICMYISIDGADISKLKELPKCVVEHMKDVIIEDIDDDSIPVLCEWIPTLQDLNSIELTFSEPCKYDYMLYQAIQHNLQEISVDYHLSIGYTHCHDLCTQRGVAELSKVISTRSTLRTDLVFRYLSTGNINYFMLEVEELLDFDVRATQRVQNCITDIAHKCNVVQLLLYGTNLHLHENFITIMNNSLHHNQSMKRLELHIADMNPSHKISTISHALRRDPSIPISNLRRSQSLCDMRTSHSTRTDKMAVFEPYKSPHGLSCPDLLEIQSLHDLHSLLHEALKCDKLYYTIDNSSSDNKSIY